MLSHPVWLYVRLHDLVALFLSTIKKEYISVCHRLFWWKDHHNKLSWKRLLSTPVKKSIFGQVYTKGPRWIKETRGNQSYQAYLKARRCVFDCILKLNFLERGPIRNTVVKFLLWSRKEFYQRDRKASLSQGFSHSILSLISEVCGNVLSNCERDWKSKLYWFFLFLSRDESNFCLRLKTS